MMSGYQCTGQYEAINHVYHCSLAAAALIPDSGLSVEAVVNNMDHPSALGFRL